jgi:hypothetical protein
MANGPDVPADEAEKIQAAQHGVPLRVWFGVLSIQKKIREKD